MCQKLRGKMSKDWLKKAEALASGKLCSANQYYKEVVESGRRFLSIGKCASIGIPVKKSEEPSVFVYNDEDARTNLCISLYERTEFFQTHKKLEIKEIETEDNLHLVRRSNLRKWGFKRYKGLPVVGFIEDEYMLESVYDISGTEEYESNKLKMLMEQQ
ncbi:hypothetical protein bcgnr5369_57380 [Bacillus cereus]